MNFEVLKNVRIFDQTRKFTLIIEGYVFFGFCIRQKEERMELTADKSFSWDGDNGGRKYICRK
jgi:hypothetical protein